ncbi:MAG: Holliday junction resolvase RuvX [Pirellulales bacterium]
MPTHLNGGESGKSVEARKFGAWLTAETGVPVEYQDERYTSVEAENLLREAGYKASERKKKLDMLAAQILLTAYLEARANPHAPKEAHDSASQAL